MGNSKLKTAKINTFSQKNAQTAGKIPPNAANSKGLPQIAKNAISLPHTQIFYLLFHAFCATLTIANADAHVLGDKTPKPPRKTPPARIRKKLLRKLLANKSIKTQFSGIAYQRALFGFENPQSKRKREKTAAEKTPFLPAGIRHTKGEKTTHIFEKGNFKVVTDELAFLELATLPNAEAALALKAFVFIISQTRRVGKSWRERGATVECSLKDFKEFSGCGDGISGNLLMKTLTAIATTKITIKNGKKHTEGSLYAEPTQIRRRGVSFKVSKGNRIFARFIRATHTIRADAARLKSADFRLFIELKSAQALNFAKTTLANLASAAGFCVEKTAGEYAHGARLAQRIRNALKRLADFDAEMKNVALECAARGKRILETRISLSQNAELPTAANDENPQAIRWKTTDAMPPFLPPLPAPKIAFSAILSDFLQKETQSPTPTPKSPPRQRWRLLRAFCRHALDFLKNGGG